VRGRSKNVNFGEEDPPLMVIDLVIVRVPKPPGSSVLISPSLAVFENAPA
jgi:hypothetical protein